MPDNGSFEHPGSPIALISRLPDWAVPSVLPIAIPPIAPSILSTGQKSFKILLNRHLMVSKSPLDNIVFSDGGYLMYIHSFIHSVFSGWG